MSVVGTGTEYLTYAAANPNVDGPIVGLGWFRIDNDIGAVGIAAGPAEAFSNFTLSVIVLASDLIRFRYFDNSNVNSATNATPGSWFGFAWKWIPETTPGVTNDATFDAWIVTEGNAAVGFTDQITQITGLNEPGGPPQGISVLTHTSDGDTPAAATVAMFQVIEADLSEAQMLTQLQYRNPQQPAWAAYAGTDFLTDRSGNGRTLTNNNGATFSAAEPSDILGDDPVVSGQIVVTAPNDIQ